MATKSLLVRAVAWMSILVLAAGCGSDVSQRSTELIRLRSYDQAVTLLREGISKRPREAKLHRLLGDALSGAASEWRFGTDPDQRRVEEAAEQALSSYKAALQLSPRDLPTLYHLACVDPDLASVQDRLWTILSLDPNHPAKVSIADRLARSDNLALAARGDSLARLSASAVKLSGEWVATIGNEGTSGSLAVIGASATLRDPSTKQPAGEIPAGSVWPCVRSGSPPQLLMDYPRQVTHTGWMLAGFARMATGQTRRLPEIILMAYAAPTTLRPFETANTRWISSPTTEVDRTGYELSEAEISTVTLLPATQSRLYRTDIRAEVREWQQVSWVEHVQDRLAVDTASVIFLPISYEQLQHKLTSLDALQLSDPKVRDALLRGQLRAGLTPAMVRAAIGHFGERRIGWDDEKLLFEAQTTATNGSAPLVLHFTDGLLSAWEMAR